VKKINCLVILELLNVFEGREKVIYFEKFISHFHEK
jgi:hypothetical protein